MKILKKTEDILVRSQYASITRRLKTKPPQYFEHAAEKKAIAAFHRVAKILPGYKKILQEHGVSPQQIKTIEDFKKYVPILDKKSVFENHALRDFCPGGSLQDVNLFWSSSGQSGTFSFAADTQMNFQKAAYGVEFLLNNVFDILKRRTLLINCTPMGVRIPARTIAVADTSVRSDVALALVRKIGREFDQIIFAGEPVFIKKLVEEGREQGVQWNSETAHVVVGGEFIPESYRTYLMGLLGIEEPSVENGIIAINMGVSELGTAIFSDNLDTIRLRHELQKNAELQKVFAQQKRHFIPEIMQFFPTTTYVETVTNDHGEDELVITLLSPSAGIPLVRYNTKDLGQIMSYETLVSHLRRLNLPGLIPQFHLPLAVIWGRDSKHQIPNSRVAHPNEIKELLYQEDQICPKLTGNFQIQNSAGKSQILLQLRPGIAMDPSIPRQLETLVKEKTNANISCQLYAYRDFPYGIELNYEKKLKYC